MPVKPTVQVRCCQCGQRGRPWSDVGGEARNAHFKYFLHDDPRTHYLCPSCYREGIGQACETHYLSEVRGA